MDKLERNYDGAVKLAVSLMLFLCVVGIFANPASAGEGRARRVTTGAKRTPKARAVDVAAAQRRLSELGYWGASADGRWSESSRQALIAFQKVEGLEVTGKLTPDVADKLDQAVRPDPLEGGPAHVEVDVASQVLYLVDDSGAVTRVLPVSTGSGKAMKIDGVDDFAYTPRGRFAVKSQVAGWRKSQLGLLYYPNYFLGGVAIHGNPEVPTFPDSHGCVRIPMFAAKELSTILTVGMPVLVHDNGSFANIPPHLRKAAADALAAQNP